MDRIKSIMALSLFSVFFPTVCCTDEDFNTWWLPPELDPYSPSWPWTLPPEGDIWWLPPGIDPDNPWPWTLPPEGDIIDTYNPFGVQNPDDSSYWQGQGSEQSTSVGRINLEANIDRPGSDYRDFDLPTADPNLCAGACARDLNCRAFTYVRPGVQGSAARCWLKYEVPAPGQSSCCVSGVK